MAHDFAKQNGYRSAGKRGAPRAATRIHPQTRSNWPWFFSGLLSGLLITSIFFLAVIDPATQQPLENAGAEQITDSGETGASSNEFGFYQYLPAAEVQVNVVPVEIVSREEADPAEYLLQAGSFQNRRDAETRLEKIRLLGLEAVIVPAIISGTTWHRVQVGPITGRARVEDTRGRLFANNIDTIILQMR